ncbi:MAG: peptidylprolyl isomerase [Methanomicrobiales archaeon]|nr:peptidylprolyl isomerase [Methanomicrobiales archaeon]
MAIKEGEFIKLSYTGKVGDNVFDTTYEDEAKKAGIFNESAVYGPVTICIGQKHVIAGLDEELASKKVGAEGTVTVPPEKAFGQRDPKRVQSFPKNQFKEKPVRGMQVRLGEQGEGTVMDVIGSKVIVDFNAPLAGATLTYTYKIEEKAEKAVDQLKGLVKLYSGRDMEVEMDGSKATVMLPPGIIYDRRWLLWRGRIIHEAFEFTKGIDEIVLVESFKRPEKKE